MYICPYMYPRGLLRIVVISFIMIMIIIIMLPLSLLSARTFINYGFLLAL